MATKNALPDELLTAEDVHAFIKTGVVESQGAAPAGVAEPRRPSAGTRPSQLTHPRSPPTKARRGFRIVPTLTSAVSEEVAAMVAQREFEAEDFLFQWATGCQMSAGNFRKRHWWPGRRTLITPHALLHSVTDDAL